MNKAYIELISKQQTVIEKQGEIISELQDRLKRQFNSDGPTGILYQLDILSEAIYYPCSNEQEQIDLKVEFIKNKTLTLCKDFGHYNEVVMPASICFVRTYDILTTSEDKEVITMRERGQ